MKPTRPLLLTSLGLFSAGLLVPPLATAADSPGSDDLQTVVRQPPIVGIDVAEMDVSKILFLNRCEDGCVIEPGPSDARFNTSSIVGSTSYISPWRHGDESWDELVRCVQAIYAPYDVEITDVDPGENVFHHEAIVAGTWDEAYSTPVGGVAPSACFPANNVISFSFANGYSDNPINICSTVAQETAHSYGLEHAFDCSDPMTYLPSCGRQFFRDATTPCGELEEFDECVCGGNAQNSHRWLKSVLGENTEPVPGPTVEIAQPAEGAMVDDGFSIAAFATHVRGVGEVELVINGTSYAVLEGHQWRRSSDPYWFEAPDLPDSVLDIDIIATNDIGSPTVQRVTVTKGAPCTSADSCLEGQSCEEGRCMHPAADGQLGDSCVTSFECESGMCPTDDSGAGYCSMSCFPTESENTCPDGFHCIGVSASDGVCWPDEESGGCRAAPGKGGGSAAWLLGLALLFAWRRRRASSIGSR